ncbi:MAG: hypothetical protein ACXWX1_09525, partial [Aeromicrobium sp.]
IPGDRSTVLFCLRWIAGHQAFIGAIDVRVEAAIPRHLRWKVNLVKQKGEWVVDKYESVATAEATAGDPSATPSAEPTEGSTDK